MAKRSADFRSRPKQRETASLDKSKTLGALSADNPITEPGQDAFGFDPFARAIATSISALSKPEGLVIGVHGPWGSGKSSAANLIRHHLGSGELESSGALTIVGFNPWWFSGVDALAIAFLREIGSAIGKSLSVQAKDAFRSLGAKLSGASPMIGAAVNLATAGVGGAAAGAASKLLGDLFESKRSVPEEHAMVAKALRDSAHRFLIVIDDLDRLNPDDALLMFKLVKSVGRLPNVMYLMVFDREMTEAAVSTRFPSEGPHFLEKIVQASFALPPLEPSDLRDLLLENISKLMGEPEQSRMVRFMNVFYDAVAPNISTPRDVVRLTNALEVTWPAVTGDVDRADFLAIQTLRLFHPKVHQAIYANRSIVCGIGSDRGTGTRISAGDCDARLLVDVPETDRLPLRKGLMRLFPALEGIWGNHFYDHTYAREWHVERRVCVGAHFDAFFRFALSDETEPAAEIRRLLDRSGDSEYVTKTLRNALAIPRRRGGTRAAVLLDELTFHAAVVPKEHIGALVAAIFSIADELEVSADQAKAFSVGGNSLRIHWLLNRLVTDRVTLIERDALFEIAAKGATLNWLIDFTERCLRQYELGREGSRPADEALVSADAAERLRALALARIQEAAQDGSLIQVNDLASNLFSWRRLMPEGQRERIKTWISEQLVHDHFVIALADSFVSLGWRHTGSDVVATRITILRKEVVAELVEPDSFRARVAELLGRKGSTDATRAVLQRFEDAWSNPEGR